MTFVRCTEQCSVYTCSKHSHTLTSAQAAPVVSAYFIYDSCYIEYSTIYSMHAHILTAS